MSIIEKEREIFILSYSAFVVQFFLFYFSEPLLNNLIKKKSLDVIVLNGKLCYYHIISFVATIDNSLVTLINI